MFLPDSCGRVLIWVARSACTMLSRPHCEHITLRHSRMAVYETDDMLTIDADAINAAALTCRTHYSLRACKVGSAHRRPLLLARGDGTPPRHTLRLAASAVHARSSTSSSARAERRPFRCHATTPCVLGYFLVLHPGPMALQSLQRPGRGRCSVCMFVIRLTPLLISTGMSPATATSSIRVLSCASPCSIPSDHAKHMMSASGTALLEVWVLQMTALMP